MTRSDTVDRALVGGTAAVWLAFVGVGVAATVALVNLGQGGHDVADGGDSGTPWGLYLVIVISALIIIGAVVLLYRARNTAAATTSQPSGSTVAGSLAQPVPAGGRGIDLPAEKLRVFGSVADLFYRSAPDRLSRSSSARGLPPQAVDRVWLRATVGVAGAMGTAMLAVAIATYMLASESNGTAWVFLGVAALITVLMALIPWFALRQLRAMLHTGEIPSRH